MADAILERRRDALAAVQRRQVIEGFAAAATEKGYAAATIGDIARHAHISKSTFYEHFADKEAAYLHLHAMTLSAVSEAYASSIARTASDPDWQARVRDFVRSRLDVAASDPIFLAQAIIEPQVATPAARQARVDAAAQTLSLHLQLAEQVGRPIPEHIAYAGMAATITFITARAPEGADAIRALEDPITDVWLRLLQLP
jgi:AcrR family transcriptional regulator